MRVCRFKTVCGAVLSAVCVVLQTNAGEEIYRSNDTVRVTYQYKMPNAANWTKSNAVLRNVTTESMIENQVQSRHENAEVRILSAQTGSVQRAQIRYQYKRKGSDTWTNGTASLLDAKTEKMAANQLRAKNPDCTIRILSMKKQ